MFLNKHNKNILVVVNDILDNFVLAGGVLLKSIHAAQNFHKIKYSKKCDVSYSPYTTSI
jgi:hypothetical protein